jgi:hypothetical protein
MFFKALLHPPVSAAEAEKDLLSRVLVAGLATAAAG